MARRLSICYPSISLHFLKNSKSNKETAINHEDVERTIEK